MRRTISYVVAGGMALGVAGSALAESGESVKQLKSQVRQLQQRVDQLEQKRDRSWMSERRKEEVKSLVREVIADAETRQSLLEGGLNAGYGDESGFYISSNDDSFRLNVNGQLQFRQVANLEGGDGGGRLDEDETGFEFRRAKLGFSGHLGSRAVTYDVRIASESENAGRDSDVTLEQALIGYQLRDDVMLEVGRTKAPLLREELTHSGRQLAAERSLVNEVFTAGYAEGFFVRWMPRSDVKVRASYNDGIRSGEADPPPAVNGAGNDFASDNSSYAGTVRVDYKLAGNWQQKKDFSAWSGEPMAVFLGGAAHYEKREVGDGGGVAGAPPAFADPADEFLIWTLDGSVEYRKWSVYAAGMGLHPSTAVPGVGSGDTYGGVVQGGYNIGDWLEPFVRWEVIEDTGSGNGTQLVTGGASYYIDGHDAKFTMDLVWALDELGTAGMNGTNLRGLGLLPDPLGGGDQLALRTQFQLMF